MGKVKGDDKLSNEVANKRRKKRKKELDALRQNVLEAKRKLREKTAPPKTQTSTFNKILNSFADRRQANDNKTQGFDSKGKKSGLKKMCNRLLPSRKPQVGIFANGSKGAEIKRVDLSLNESERARFEGDLHKVLGDVKRKSKEFKSDAFNKILDSQSAENEKMETDEQVIVRIPNERLGDKTEENEVAKNHNGKRKLQVCVDLDGKTAKKHHAGMENMKVVVEYTEGKSELNNSQDKKWKRSLFQDEGDDFGPVPVTSVEQLRFSPKIGKPVIKDNPPEAKVSLGAPQEKLDTKKINFHYEKLGRMAATRYEELCRKVCIENFDKSLQEIPHIDPLKKVKQSLMAVYIETYKQKTLEKNIEKAKLFAQNCLSANSSHKDKHKNEEDADDERVKSNGASILSPRGVCRGFDNSKNFHHREAPRISSVGSNALMTKAFELNERGETTIRPLTRGQFSPQAAEINERDNSSLDINYENSRISLRSDILEFLKIDEDTESTTNRNSNGILSPRLARLPSNRQKIMLRYLEEVNNQEPGGVYGSICSPEVSAVSQENDNAEKCYRDDPLKRHKKRTTTKSRNAQADKELVEMRCQTPRQENNVESTRYPLDVNGDSVRKCLELNPTEFSVIEDRPSRAAVKNLASASRSVLACIPSDQGEFMLRYLQGVKNENPTEKDKAKRFVDMPEFDKPKKRCLGNPLKRHQIKNNLAEHSGKSERHMPAILRKSRYRMSDKKSHAIGTALQASEILQSKKSKYKIENSSNGKRSLDAIFFDERQTSRNPPLNDLPFVAHMDSTDSPEVMGFIQNTLENANSTNRGAEVGTPTAINNFYNSNKNNFKANRDFEDDRPSYGLTIEPRNMADRLKAANSPVHNSMENIGGINFRDNRRSLNLPIFPHPQRTDLRSCGTNCTNEEKIIVAEDQEMQRFPVFLKRATDSSMKNGTRCDWLFSEIAKPRVIIIKNPTAREIGEDVRREISYQDDYQTRNQNSSAGLTFPKFPQGVKVGLMHPVHLKNGRQNLQQFHMTDGNVFENAGTFRQSEEPRMRKNGVRIPLRSQIPRITSQNGMQKIVDHTHAGQEPRYEPMSFFQPRTADVSGSRKILHHNPSTNNQIHAGCSSEYSCNDANLNLQQNCDSTEAAVQFCDSRGAAGYVLPDNKRESFCRSAINPAETTERISHCHNCGPVLSRAKNPSHGYLIDPRCPQDGYQWNQIDGSGAPIYQRVIQPVYNVIDAYRPQVPHNTFFPTELL